MAGIRDVVQGLISRNGVQAAVVLSGDGLTVDHAARDRVDAEALSALSATIAQHAERLGEAAERGALATGVLEFEEGLLVMARLGHGNALVLLIEPETNIGALLYDLRRHRPALSDLL